MAIIQRSAQDLMVNVDKAIGELTQEFERSWTLFYREHDLASRLFELIQARLQHIQVKDKSGEPHYLVHGEWPTPFKCDMSNGAFELMGDDTPYHRGHYDLVVLNPEFVARNEFDVVRSYSFEQMRQALPEDYDGPVAVLYGIELMFRRDRRKGIDDAWLAGITQDHNKLKASMDRRNLMAKATTLAFDGYPTDERTAEFARRFEGDSSVRYVVPADSKS